GKVPAPGTVSSFLLRKNLETGGINNGLREVCRRYSPPGAAATSYRCLIASSAQGLLPAGVSSLAVPVVGAASPVYEYNTHQT
ncbi:hypothetical protein, partial [Victivallis vadensis]|uniref:hypothetical protein n=1 Tax=Victivallis vadensis TaxID=172901 RepID=UPI0026DB7C09